MAILFTLYLFSIGLSSSQPLLLPGLDRYFKYIKGAFSLKIYALIYLCYMAVIYAVMNIMTVRYLRKSPAWLIKEGG